MSVTPLFSNLKTLKLHDLCKLEIFPIEIAHPHTHTHTHTKTFLHFCLSNLVNTNSICSEITKSTNPNRNHSLFKPEFAGCINIRDPLSRPIKMYKFES